MKLAQFTNFHGGEAVSVHHVGQWIYSFSGIVKSITFSLTIFPVLSLFIYGKYTTKLKTETHYLL